jgi:hypothetical protein
MRRSSMASPQDWASWKQQRVRKIIPNQ